MLADLLQILLEARQNLTSQPGGPARAFLVHMLHEVGADFGKVLHEVERVL